MADDFQRGRGGDGPPASGDQVLQIYEAQDYEARFIADPADRGTEGLEREKQGAYNWTHHPNYGGSGWNLVLTINDDGTKRMHFMENPETGEAVNITGLPGYESWQEEFPDSGGSALSYEGGPVSLSDQLTAIQLQERSERNRNLLKKKAEMGGAVPGGWLSVQATPGKTYFAPHETQRQVGETPEEHQERLRLMGALPEQAQYRPAISVSRDNRTLKNAMRKMENDDG